MEPNRKKGHNRKGFHLKKHKKADDSRSFDPRPTNREGNDKKPVLFQLGSIASYGVSDVRIKADKEITNRRSASQSLSSVSSSGNILEVNAKERIYSLSFDSSQHKRELLSLSLKLSELQGSSDTPGSQVSGVTQASLEPALLSPSLQMMDRDGSDQPQTKSLPTLERNLSTVSNDSLFSLSIGENAIARDELFSYRDFKAGKSFDMEDKASEILPTDSEDKSSNSSVLWRNIGDCNNSDEAQSSTQSISYPIRKKNKKKKKVRKKTKQQKQKKRCCSWLCCKWPSCDYDLLSCCKRLKCCSCCASCGWFFCCCSGSSKR